MSCFVEWMYTFYFSSFLILSLPPCSTTFITLTFLPLISQVMWGWGFERVVVQLATKLSPTKNAFSLNRIFGGPVCLTVKNKSRRSMNWSWVEHRALTDDVKVCLVWRFRKNWIIDRNLTVVAARGIEIQIRQSHNALVWLGKLPGMKRHMNWARKGLDFRLNRSRAHKFIRRPPPPVCYP